MAAPPYVLSPLAPLGLRERQLELSDAWCAREEVLRRCAAQRLLVERAASVAMATADARLIERSEMASEAAARNASRPHSASAGSDGAGGGEEPMKPPVSAISALVRSTVFAAQTAEAAAAKAENRNRDDTIYETAVEMIASGGAAGLVLELSNPNRTSASELAAALVSNLSGLARRTAANGGGASGGGGAAAGARAFTSSAAMLLSPNGADGADVAARDAWPVQIYSQMERAVRLHDKQIAAREREREREADGANKAGEDGEDGEDDGGGDDDDETLGGGNRRVEMRGPEREVRQIIQDAYEGRPPAQGPDPIKMKGAMLKALIAVGQFNPTAIHQGGGGTPGPSSSANAASLARSSAALSATSQSAASGGGGAAAGVGDDDDDSGPPLGVLAAVAGATAAGVHASVTALGAIELSRNDLIADDNARGANGGRTAADDKPPPPIEAPLPTATRFLNLCADDDSRRRLSKWVHVDAILNTARGEDTCRALAERCVPLQPDEVHRERQTLTSLASLATWRAAAVSNDRRTPDEINAEIALRASNAQLHLGFDANDLQRDLERAQGEMPTVGEAVAERVRAENEEALSSLVVKRLTLRMCLQGSNP